MTDLGPSDQKREDLLGLFPSGARVDDDELVLRGHRATDLAQKFETPVLIIDEIALRERAQRYKDGLAKRWPNSQVVWASKSLPCTSLYHLMHEEGLGVDVAGGGELVMALAAGVDPSHIVLHGNAKTSAEIAMALDANVGTIVIDNFDDIDRLEHLARREQGVLVRILPGITTATHEAVATGHGASKFGLMLQDATRAFERVRASAFLRLDGVHVHVGSQILSTEPFTQAVQVIASLGEFDTYDLGGGLGARYTYDEHPPSVEAYLDALVGAAHQFLPESSRLLVEPGRSMIAEAATTLYRVVSVKRSGPRVFVAVDGGMGDNLEVSLYGQRFEATVANRFGGGEDCALVGRHCESGDLLIDRVALRDCRVGDVIAVPVTGAYCLTMANNYNGALRPPIVMVREGATREVLRRETYEDLLRRDLKE